MNKIRLWIIRRCLKKIFLLLYLWISMWKTDDAPSSSKRIDKRSIIKRRCRSRRKRLKDGWLGEVSRERSFDNEKSTFDCERPAKRIWELTMGNGKKTIYLEKTEELKKRFDTSRWERERDKTENDWQKNILTSWNRFVKIWSLMSKIFVYNFLRIRYANLYDT